jgi:hypothetical protein
MARQTMTLNGLDAVEAEAEAPIAAILGALVALASTAIVWTVLYAVIKSAIFILSNALAL